ncbi:Sir2 family NAD+-dependent deacetylase [Bdellovibrionota bacterium FG-2]
MTTKINIVILTGAGISAESGIKTFRDHNGLWENHSVEEVASLIGFLKHPEVVQKFYNQRRAQLLEQEIRPNAAHLALAKLEAVWPGKFLLVTQNVDDLHDRAGSKSLIHMHGELLRVKCLRSGEPFEWKADITVLSRCACCNLTGTLRPQIVWFGEMPLEMERISEAVESCDVFLAIGTSGNVYPAAGFVSRAPEAARKIEVNKEGSEISAHFSEIRTGLASECVPSLVSELIEEYTDTSSEDGAGK